MQKIIDRLKEPSTYASITGILMLVGVNVDQAWVDAAVSLGGAVAGVLGIVLAEKGKKDNVKP